MCLPITVYGAHSPPRMTFPFLLIFLSLFASWTFLSVLGNERQRRVQGRPPAQSGKPPEPPVGR